MRVRTDKKLEVVKVKRDGQEWPFEVIPMDPVEEEELRKKYTSYDRQNGQVIPVIDFIGIKIEKAQTEIKNWPCTDNNDNLIPCTPENIKKVWLLNSDLINEVLAKTAEISAGIISRKAQEKKI